MTWQLCTSLSGHRRSVIMQGLTLTQLMCFPSPTSGLSRQMLPCRVMHRGLVGFNSLFFLAGWTAHPLCGSSAWSPPQVPQSVTKGGCETVPLYFCGYFTMIHIFERENLSTYLKTMNPSQASRDHGKPLAFLEGQLCLRRLGVSPRPPRNGTGGGHLWLC